MLSKIDQKVRCQWGNIDPLLTEYHDEEWGIPIHDDQKLFEMLCLEVAQAELADDLEETGWVS